MDAWDGHALYRAMDAQRRTRGLSWSGAAAEIWALSSELNAARQDHPISPATLSGIARRGDTTCQHALFILRWLDRAPEDFLTGGPGPFSAPLPRAGPDRRPRWHLRRLAEALDGRRREEQRTWAQLARELHCTPSQLQGLRRARFATGMSLAMRITQWLQRPAADFVYLATW